jgi:nucleoid-associated protein YgaU
MDRRRGLGLVALIVLVVGAIALLYYDQRNREATTAFAPAGTTEEAAPAATPADATADAGAAGETPTEVAAAPAGVEAAPAGTADAAPADSSAAVAAPEPAAATEPPAGTAAAGAPAVAATEPAASEAAPADAAAAETEIAAVEPGTEVAPGGEAVVPLPGQDVEPLPPVGVPTFDIVRVEPSGDAVIAGQAEPNAMVEIVDGSTVIATAEANETGDFAIALEKPLDPGTYDLAIQTTSPDESVVMLSDQRVTVSVPEEGTEVLVVLNQPGEASTVMQVPPAEEVAAAEAAAGASAAGQQEQQVAAAPDAAGDAPDAMAAGEQPAENQVAAVEPAAVEPAAADPAASESGTEGTTVASAPADAGTSVASGAGTAPAEPGSAEPAPTPAATPATPTVAAVDTDANSAGAPEDAQVAAAAAPEAPAAAPGESGPAGEGAAAVASAPTEPTVILPAPPLPPPPPPAPMVMVAAVEADVDGTLYIAGTATTGETVRVYLDDALIGEATPSPSGTWLVETTADLPAGNYLVRADQISGDGTVIARSEVPFEREVEVAILKPTVAAPSAATGGTAMTGTMPEVETVIIKKGDNLWRIARAAWGKGIRWSTIYAANGEQIRDPHWIYPGQVFVMPKGDAAWSN